MLLPESATLRLYFTARSIICCNLCTFEANVAIISLRVGFSLNSLSSVLPTVFSLMV